MNTVLTLGFRKLGLVCCLTEMRAIPSQVYCNDSWVSLVKVRSILLISCILLIFFLGQSTGLAKIIGRITEPGAFGVFTHPVVEASFRLYQWRDSLELILLDWTPLNFELAQDVGFLFNFADIFSDIFFSGQNMSLLLHQAIP